MKRAWILIASLAIVAYGCQGSSETTSATGSTGSTGTPTAPPTGAAPSVAALEVLTKNCAGCHGAQNPKEGISLVSLDAALKGGEHGPVIVAGDPAASLLVKAMKGDGAKQMPPGKPLPAEDIAKVEAWIKDGAKL